MILFCRTVDKIEASTSRTPALLHVNYKSGIVLKQLQFGVNSIFSACSNQTEMSTHASKSSRNNQGGTVIIHRAGAFLRQQVSPSFTSFFHALQLQVLIFVGILSMIFFTNSSLHL